LYYALFGGIEQVLQGTPGFAQRATLRGFVRKLPVKLGSVRAQRVEIVGQFQPGAPKPAICFARQLEVLAQLFDFGLKRGRFPVDLIKLGA